MSRILVLVVTSFLLAIAVSAHAEKKVYACKDAGGNAIFSPNPCGTDAKELSVDPGRAPAPAARSSGAQTVAPPQPSNALQDISDSVADSTCRSDAKRAARYFDDSQIQELERRKRNLETQGTYARNNLAGSVYLNGIRNEIGDLDIAIAQERTRITQANAVTESSLTAAYAECDKRKADRAQARADANRAR
jgi:hypothetical protein